MNTQLSTYSGSGVLQPPCPAKPAKASHHLPISSPLSLSFFLLFPCLSVLSLSVICSLSITQFYISLSPFFFSHPLPFSLIFSLFFSFYLSPWSFLSLPGSPLLSPSQPGSDSETLSFSIAPFSYLSISL